MSLTVHLANALTEDSLEDILSMLADEYPKEVLKWIDEHVMDARSHSDTQEIVWK